MKNKKRKRRVKGEDLNCRKFAPTRPEGAEAPSPGQSPWVNQQSTLRPARAKALKISRQKHLLHNSMKKMPLTKPIIVTQKFYSQNEKLILA